MESLTAKKMVSLIAVLSFIFLPFPASEISAATPLGLTPSPIGVKAAGSDQVTSDQVQTNLEAAKKEAQRNITAIGQMALVSASDIATKVDEAKKKASEVAALAARVKDIQKNPKTNAQVKKEATQLLSSLASVLNGDMGQKTRSYYGKLKAVLNQWNTFLKELNKLSMQLNNNNALSIQTKLDKLKRPDADPMSELTRAAQLLSDFLQSHPSDQDIQTAIDQAQNKIKGLAKAVAEGQKFVARIRETINKLSGDLSKMMDLMKKIPQDALNSDTLTSLKNFMDTDESFRRNLLLDDYYHAIQFNGVDLPNKNLTKWQDYLSKLNDYKKNPTGSAPQPPSPVVGNIAIQNDPVALLRERIAGGQQILRNLRTSDGGRIEIFSNQSDIFNPSCQPGVAGPVCREKVTVLVYYSAAGAPTKLTISADTRDVSKTFTDIKIINCGDVVLQGHEYDCKNEMKDLTDPHQLSPYVFVGSYLPPWMISANNYFVR